VRYSLRFAGVSYLDEKLPVQGFTGRERDDVAYWECEWHQAETEIRIPFVSSAKLVIRFTGFSFEHAHR